MSTVFPSTRIRGSPIQAQCSTIPPSVYFWPPVLTYMQLAARPLDVVSKSAAAVHTRRSMLPHPFQRPSMLMCVILRISIASPQAASPAVCSHKAAVEISRVPACSLPLIGALSFSQPHPTIRALHSDLSLRYLPCGRVRRVTIYGRCEWELGRECSWTSPHRVLG